MTFDEFLARIADRVPGFAGMYFDRDGSLVLRSTAELSSTAVREAVASQGSSLLTLRARQSLATGAGVRVESAQFDFRELLQLKRIVYRDIPFRGVVFVDIDEVRNRIWIGTETESARNELRADIESAGLPLAAFMITSGHKVHSEQRLSDQFRPVPGGVSVAIPAPGNTFRDCTVTANVRISDDDYFLTASHCTYRFGDGQDGGYAYQETGGVSGDLIGQEAYDPDLYPGGVGECPDSVEIEEVEYEVQGCRYSDVAVYAYTSSTLSDYGTVARTEELGSTTIDNSTPRFLISAESFQYPLIGTEVYKMGQATGWTADTVTHGQETWPGVDNTCVDVVTLHNGNAIGVFCQAVANYNSAGSDSGAPVFTWDGYSSYIELVGIHKGYIEGLGRTFTPWVYVTFELSGETGGWEIAY